MKLLHVIRVIFVALLCSQGSSVLAVSLFRTAAQESSEPKYVAIKVNGKSAVGGICVDIMRAIERIDSSIQFVGDQDWEPRPRIEAGIEAGKLDTICGLLGTKERMDKFDFVETPLFSVDYFLAVRADDDVKIENWNDVRKLGNGGVILVTHSFGVIYLLQEVGGLKIDDSATSALSNLNKLVAGRGRFYCHRSPGINAEIRRAGLERRIKVLPTVMEHQKFYMAMSKSLAPDNSRKLRAAIALLDSRGELARIFDKYKD